MGTSCSGSGIKYIQCLEEMSYSENDIFAHDIFRASTIYAGWKEGLVQSLDLDIGNITNNFYTTMEISLNTNLSYQLLIMDPKIQIFSEIPNIYPITRLSLPKQYDGALQLYLKVHLDMPNTPILLTVEILFFAFIKGNET